MIKLTSHFQARRVGVERIREFNDRLCIIMIACLRASKQVLNLPVRCVYKCEVQVHYQISIAVLSRAYEIRKVPL